MHCTFLTVADPDVGLGHLSRCDALATALRVRGFTTQIIIATQTGSDWLALYAPETQWHVESWTTDPDICSRVISNSDQLFVDAYDIAPTVLKKIEELIETPVFFDDFGTNIPTSGIVINGSPGACALEYPDRAGLVFLLGPDYHVLRSAFWHPTKRKTRKRVRKIGAMLGGTDNLRQIDNVLTVISETIPENIVVFAIGAKSSISENHDVVATGRLSAGQMKELFDSLDFLVAAAGQTVAEAVSCTLPTIMLQTAENQRYNIIGWKERECAVFGGNLSKPEYDSLLRASCMMVLDPDVRSNMSIKDAVLHIEKSTMNVANSISRLCTHYKDGAKAIPFPILDGEAQKEVLSWRNDWQVAQWMANQDRISPEAHLAFVKNLPFDDTKAFYRVNHKSVGIGVVDLTEIDRVSRRAEVGLYRNPNLSTYRVNEKPAGVLLMDMIETIAHHEGIVTLWLKVRRDNQRAIRLYHAVGYQEFRTDDTYRYYEKRLQ